MRLARVLLPAIMGFALLASTPLAAQHHRRKDTTRKSAPSCSKGTPCGMTCIPAGRTCHLGESPNAAAHDNRGRIERSESAKTRFMRETGHPNGWPGHVVDHILPLACGGADDPSNMQWQTVEEAKAKDKVERRGCSR